MAAGHGGQILVVGGDRGAGGRRRCRLSTWANIELRDIGRPLRVFQVGGGEFGLLRSAESGPARLPVPSSTLVGRDG